MSEERSLDVLFILDATNSTAPIIDAVKNKVSKIARNVQTEYPSAFIRYGVICYRDPIDHPGDKHSAFRFSTSIDKVEDFLNSPAAKQYGGGDRPEDVAGAFEIAFGSYKWGPIGTIVWIADAPPHGKIFSGESDDKYDDQVVRLQKILNDFARNQNISLQVYSVNDGLESAKNEVLRIYQENGRSDVIWKNWIPTEDGGSFRFVFPGPSPSPPVSGSSRSPPPSVSLPAIPPPIPPPSSPFPSVPILSSPSPSVSFPSQPLGSSPTPFDPSKPGKYPPSFGHTSLNPSNPSLPSFGHTSLNPSNPSPPSSYLLPNPTTSSEYNPYLDSSPNINEPPYPVQIPKFERPEINFDEIQPQDSPLPDAHRGRPSVHNIQDSLYKAIANSFH